MSKTIVITGASGNLGRKLSVYLATDKAYELRLFDLVEDPTRGVQGADLCQSSAAWSEQLAGVDVVVHLAANTDPAADWTHVVGPNIDGLLKLYLAATQARVSRIVLASSVWVLNGHRFKQGPLSPTTPLDPGGNIYGATKLFAERIAKAFFEAHGLTTVVVRLGACRPGHNTATDALETSPWVQDCWLSDRDMCRGIETAINATVSGFEIINLMSANPRSRWDLRSAETLGYHPLDQHVTQNRWQQAMKSNLFRLGRITMPRVIDRLISWHW